MKPTRPLMRYHGGKWRLAEWLISHFPPHEVYVEPFGGAASVLLQKERSYSEVYNDLDSGIVNVFRVLQDPQMRESLMQKLYFTPYAREEFELAYVDTDDMVESARRTIIRAQMGFGSGGATKGTTGFRRDTVRKYSTAMMNWTQYLDALPPIVERMIGVQIENRPALDVIRTNDRPEVLFYVDPPYMHSTRVMDGTTRYYRHEMTEDDHAELLDCLKNVVGMVILNGYPSEMYESSLSGWTRREKQSRASASRGTSMRTEVIWINPACAAALESRISQSVMFA